ncbi:unnamed protein product [Alopecurus aequalis]
MISSKKLAQLSKKWQGIGAFGRKRVATLDKDIHPSHSLVAGKGHFVVYSSDGMRFEVPLVCLHTTVFEELLRMSQEFGFTGDGRITLPCDTAMMEYVMCLLRREASEDVERALVSSIVMTCHHPGRMMQPPCGLQLLKSEDLQLILSFFHLHLFFPDSQIPFPSKSKQATMMSSKKLAQLSKKWQGIGTIGRRWATTADKGVHPSCSSVAGKGHFIAYSDGRRFEIPLACLRTTLFEELLRMSQEEFGFTSDGRIRLPCDTTMMEYAMCLLRREASEDVERALLNSITMTCHHPIRIMQVPTDLNQQFAVWST